MNLSDLSLALSSDPFRHGFEMSGGIVFKWKCQVCLVVDNPPEFFYKEGGSLNNSNVVIGQIDCLRFI